MGGATAAGLMEANNDGMTPGNTGTDVPAAGDHVYDPTNMGGATAAGPMEANTAGMTPGNTGATAAAMEANTAGMTPGNTGTNVPAAGDHVYDPTMMGGADMTGITMPL